MKYRPSLFGRKEMMKMLSEGYTEIETSMEKHEHVKAGEAANDIDNCALCETYRKDSNLYEWNNSFHYGCSNKCTFNKYFKKRCVDISTTEFKNYDELMYKKVEILYINELLEKEICR